MGYYSSLDLTIKEAGYGGEYWRRVPRCPECGGKRCIVGFNVIFDVECENPRCREYGKPKKVRLK